MSTSSSKEEPNENSYIIDSESPAELARLLQQDRLFTKTLGLLPELPDHSTFHSILDLACGPGGWAMEVAKAFPGMQMTGVDISENMIEYAQAQAEAEQLSNVRFMVMNALKPLNFPDNSFDLVNGRLIAGFVPKAGWLSLVQECWRITRPGGVVCLTEGEPSISNGNVSQELGYMLIQAMFLAGRTFSPYGLNTTLMLMPFLRSVGYQNVQGRAYVIEFSTGTEAHEPIYQNAMAASKLIQPFLVKMGVTTQEEADRLYNQLAEEMRSEDFCGIWYFLKAWGQKPEKAI